MNKYSIEVFADYFQFYLWDSDVSPDAPTAYSEDDIARMIKAEPGILVVMPRRNMDVPVEVEIHETDPGYVDAQWDHVAESALALPNGKLQVHECTGGPVLDVNIQPGLYRVRVHFAGLGSVSPDGLDGDDSYTIVLWPSDDETTCTKKQWSPSAAG